MAITLYSTWVRSVYGGNMAQTLMKRFTMDLDAQHPEKGGHDLLPAYAHYGLLMRGLGRIPIEILNEKPGWLLSEANKAKSSFPLAIMSNKTPFFGLGDAFSYGYIFYAPSETPDNLDPIELICAFPLNAYTYLRKDNNGCTYPKEDPEVPPKDRATADKFCHELGIHTSDAWTQHYDSSNNPDYDCSLDMRDKRHAHATFNIFLDACQFVRRLNNIYYLVNNVLLAKAYDDEHPEKLPVQAIFLNLKYESAENIKVVTKLQTELQEKIGKDIPIVIIRFPSKSDEYFSVEIENFPRSNDVHSHVKWVSPEKKSISFYTPAPFKSILTAESNVDPSRTPVSEESTKRQRRRSRYFHSAKRHFNEFIDKTKRKIKGY